MFYHSIGDADPLRSGEAFSLREIAKQLPYVDADSTDELFFLQPTTSRRENLRKRIRRFRGTAG